MARGGGGRIVNVASRAGMSGAAAGVAYTASEFVRLNCIERGGWMC
jgi:NAD(P)-dependent dehydrogenase (short-subunit alcohol dehydrogenase family)